MIMCACGPNNIEISTSVVQVVNPPTMNIGEVVYANGYPIGIVIAVDKLNQGLVTVQLDSTSVEIQADGELPVFNRELIKE
jgi:hypothetical protein